MSETPENKDSPTGNVVRAASVIACSATGNVCQIEDLERACGIIPQSPNINATPASEPATGASSEGDASNDVIMSSPTAVQPPACVMTCSRKSSEGAAAAGQSSLIETRPLRARSRPGVALMQGLTSQEQEAPGRGVRNVGATQPEPMETEDLPAVGQPSKGDSKKDLTAVTKKSPPRRSISTCSASAIARLGDAFVNEAGRERQERRTRRSTRNTSANSDPSVLRRTRSHHSRNLRSNLRNLVDDSMGSIISTLKPSVVNTYRGNRDVPKSRSVASRARKTELRNVPTATDTSEPIARTATNTSGRSTPATTIAADHEMQHIVESNSNPRSTTETSTNQMPPNTLPTTSTFSEITIDQNDEGTIVLTSFSDSGTSTDTTLSIENGIRAIAAALAVPIPKDGVQVLTFPTDITFGGEIIGEATVEIQQVELMPIAFTEDDSNESNVADNVAPSNNITGNEQSASDTIMSTNASNVTMHAENTDVRPLSGTDDPSPIFILPCVSVLETTPAPSDDTDSATLTDLCRGEIAPKDAAGNGQNGHN